MLTIEHGADSCIAAGWVESCLLHAQLATPFMHCKKRDLTVKPPGCAGPSSEGPQPF